MKKLVVRKLSANLLNAKIANACYPASSPEQKIRDKNIEAITANGDITVSNNRSRGKLNAGKKSDARAAGSDRAAQKIPIHR